MTFAPEWLTGSPSLPEASDVLLFWIYLVLMNSVWVVVPVLLMYDSWREISSALPGTTRPPYTQQGRQEVASHSKSE